MTMKKRLMYIAGLAIAVEIGFMIGYSTPKPYTETDLFIIKSYVLGELNLVDEPVKITNREFKRLDINQDGEISSMDYVKIKNKMKGIE